MLIERQLFGCFRERIIDSRERLGLGGTKLNLRSCKIHQQSRDLVLHINASVIQRIAVELVIARVLSTAREQCGCRSVGKTTEAKLNGGSLSPAFLCTAAFKTQLRILGREKPIRYFPSEFIASKGVSSTLDRVASTANTRNDTGQGRGAKVGISQKKIAARMIPVRGRRDNIKSQYHALSQPGTVAPDLFRSLQHCHPLCHSKLTQ